MSNANKLNLHSLQTEWKVAAIYLNVKIDFMHFFPMEHSLLLFYCHITKLVQNNSEKGFRFRDHLSQKMASSEFCHPSIIINLHNKSS